LKNASREAARARVPQFDRSRSALVEVEELVTRRLLRGAEDFAVVDAHGQGLFESLGNLLGFEARRPNVDAAPDGVWRVGDQIAMAFAA
jgi:hypothetical protein